MLVILAMFQVFILGKKHTKEWWHLPTYTKDLHTGSIPSFILMYSVCQNDDQTVKPDTSICF